MNKKTIVLGASPNPSRYSYLAINKLRTYGHSVIPIGRKKGVIDGISILNDKPGNLDDIDTITLYLNAQNQKEFYDYILYLHPKRIIFNPGAENAELEDLAKRNNIEALNACTLVLLSTSQY